jgi:hypothetical protein
MYYATSQEMSYHEAFGLFNILNPSSRTMALVSIVPLTEISTRNLSQGKEQPALDSDLTSICEPIF